MNMEVKRPRKIKVRLGRNSYTIFIGTLSKFAKEMANLTAERQIALITDSNVAATGHTETVCELLSTASELGMITLKPGERTKTLEAVGGICGFAARHNFDRKSRFVALSGGVGGDMTGFAAGIYKRGVDFIQIPTTLLAMVDSSVGGKTGVDIEEGKNLIGLFHQPLGVFIDPAFLVTLPKREWRNGLAEIIKYGVICDREFFDFLSKNRSKLLNAPDGEFYAEIIEKCCQLKADVVSKDEKENGLRAILNFGHTFGHAVELVSRFKVSHGAAVGYGMVLAGRFAVKLGMFKEDEQSKLETLLHYVKIPISCPIKTNAKEIINAMMTDKKNIGSQIKLILPTSIGKVEISDKISNKEIEKFLKEEL